ncbi:hypothetical protein RUM8411_03672 [Ruegeria meonggei]|uniref:Uncharacterized protein n=1 Tax=Ruegeria meonggei TaxID=1446476 RepID=A0A1X7A5J9_9RHOB|nr:hypothetical protein RUM8411_03672 [Ruegeria meonggei]
MSVAEMSVNYLIAKGKTCQICSITGIEPQSADQMRPCWQQYATHHVCISIQLTYASAGAVLDKLLGIGQTRCVV